MVGQQTIRESLSQLVAGLDEISLLLFTTFEFDASFFEQNVLLHLNPDHSRLQTAEEIQGLETWAADNGVVVFHDFGRIPRATQKSVHVPTVPVAPRSENGAGIFHPKVIVAHGRVGQQEELRLFVASANLSYSGWGQNLEVASVVRVEDVAVAKPLARLLDYLQTLAQEFVDDELLNRIANASAFAESVTDTTPSTRPKLHVTLPGEAENIFNRLTETTGPLTIISPFFSGESFFRLLDKTFGKRGIRIAPGTKNVDQTELPPNSLNLIAQATSMSLCYMVENGERIERRQHLKCYGFDEGVICGSHNASFNALGGLKIGPQNVEVSVEWPGATLDAFIRPATVDDFEPAEEESEPPRPVVEPGVAPLVSFTADWRKEIVVLRVMDPDEWHLGRFWVVFPSSDPISLDRFTGEPASIGLQAVNRMALGQNKTFEIWGADPAATEPIYCGFINEIHPEERIRYREPTIESAFQTWIHMREDPKATDLAEPIMELGGRESEIIKLPLARHGGRLENYFFIFLGVQRMRDYLSGELNKDEFARRVRALVYQASGSIENIVGNVELALKSDEEHSLSERIPRGILATELINVLAEIDHEDVLPKKDELMTRLEGLKKDFDAFIAASTNPTVQRLGALLTQSEQTNV